MCHQNDILATVMRCATGVYCIHLHVTKYVASLEAQQETERERARHHQQRGQWAVITSDRPESTRTTTTNIIIA